MTLAMLDWAPNALRVEDAVRDILRRAGHADLSVAACKAWAREFIIAVVPSWRPGRPLAWDDAQRVGQRFEVFMASPHPERETFIAPRKKRGPRLGAVRRGHR